ncbi:MAG: hypothetical protein AAGN66_10930 [Acidobacteriota bacterium]
MRWSRLKKTIESRFAESLGGRVEVRSTKYRYGHENIGRGILVVDGEEVANFCTFRFYNELADTAEVLEEAGAKPRAAFREAEERLRRDGVLTQEQFYGRLEDFLRMPFDDALASSDVLIQALALLDGRLGKRRLRRMAEEPPEQPLHRRLFELRCGAEGVRIRAAEAPLVEDAG